MKNNNKPETLKTVDLNKLTAVTGGAWNGGTSSWNNWSSQNWTSPNWSR